MLVGQDWELVANKSGATRLGFALLLKFFELEARFPRGPEEVPSPPHGLRAAPRLSPQPSPPPTANPTTGTSGRSWVTRWLDSPPPHPTGKALTAVQRSVVAIANLVSRDSSLGTALS